MNTLTDNQIHIIVDKAVLLRIIDEADITGAYNKANLLSKIYSAMYIDNDMGLCKWLKLRYEERFGRIGI